MTDMIRYWLVLLQVLLQLWPGALVCCCLSTPPAFRTRVESYKLEGNNYGYCSSDWLRSMRLKSFLGKSSWLQVCWLQVCLRLSIGCYIQSLHCGVLFMQSHRRAWARVSLGCDKPGRWQPGVSELNHSWYLCGFMNALCSKHIR
jgi:hypothetical protein